MTIASSAASSCGANSANQQRVIKHETNNFEWLRHRGVFDTNGTARHRSEAASTGITDFPITASI
jgi:hypothetical protein